MRTLLLLRGAPGSGKSTFIKDNGLEPYTLEADRFRTLACDPQLSVEGQLEISQSNDGIAWKMLFQALELRMQRGDFTVVDATHSNPHMLTKYKKLIQRYRYRCYYMEFDPGLEEVLRRNAERDEYKRVPEDAVERIYAMCRNTKMQSYATRIESLSEIENYVTIDLTGQYDRAVVIGDVHGCYDALMKAIDGPALDSRTMYVFSGDLLDRGIQNRECLGFYLDIMDKPNVVFVEGNHDTHIREWAENAWQTCDDGTPRIPRDFRNTIAAVTDGLDDDGKAALMPRVRDLARRMRVCYAFTLGTQRVFVCHGGLSAIPTKGMAYVAARQMIKGVGRYETPIDEAYEKAYAEGRTQPFTQIHGHRHTQSTQHSICLENRVEFGGSLMTAVVAPDGIDVHATKNDVYKETTIDEKHVYDGISKPWLTPTQNDETNRLAQNPHVRVKRLDDHNLMSLNFDRKAFDKGIWDGMTDRARGLFVDQTTGEVRLRSYNKFFNLYENETVNPKRLASTLSFPLAAYWKHNGFLGIMSVVNGDVVLASKSTTEGPFADMFREIWGTLDASDREAMKCAAEKYRCSLVFEVCHVNDRHIIDFGENHLVLLDAIENKYDINGIDVDRKFSDMVKDTIACTSPMLWKKEHIANFDDMDELADFCRRMHHRRDIEGIVVQDQNGFMFKVKFHYYVTMKQLRGDLRYAQQSYKSGQLQFGRFRDARTVKFIAWFVNSMPYDEWKDMHIIDAIKAYEKANSLLMALEP